MSNHAYEVALYGEFFAKDLRAILNRITLHSESSHPMHTREVVFEPMHAGRDLPSEQGILRARKELLHISGEKEGWWVSLLLHSGDLELRYAQGSLLLLEAGICSSAPRSNCQALGNMSCCRGCTQLC